MPPLKITQKHHKHLNNPFPSSPNSLPLIHGTLSFNPTKLPHHQTFPIGNDFQLNWTATNGGSLSISHLSNPQSSIWSTIPGEPFISAASAQTEIEESRGSFAIRDGEISFICNHQSIDQIISMHNQEANDRSYTNDGTHLPVLLISGLVFSEKTQKLKGSASSSLTARYWVILDQKNTNQIGYQVRFGEFVQQQSPRTSLVRFKFRYAKWKRLRFRRRRFACFRARRGFVDLAYSSEDDGEDEKVGVIREFDRVVITYSSERDERFYGFGEQFSHMEFKGRRVPILVQEQGIGRGDQPITFAANLVSYR